MDKITPSLYGIPATEIANTTLEAVPTVHRNVLEWSDVEDIAKSLFSIWHNGSELEWAKIAWEHITAAGLAKTDTEAERCRAALRLLALASFYADWCRASSDEEPVVTIYQYVDSLDLDPFYVGLWLEPDERSEFGYLEDDAVIRNAACELARREQPIVKKTLIEGFGGKAELTASLWRTIPSAAVGQEGFGDAGEDESAIESDYAHRNRNSGQQIPLPMFKNDKNCPD